MKKYMKNLVNITFFIITFYLLFKFIQILWEFVFIPIFGASNWHPLFELFVMIALICFNIVISYIVSIKITDIVNHYYKFDK